MHMGETIGNAADFWRLRIRTIDDLDEADFQWRDDILYRTPPTQHLEARERWRVEAVSVDDPERAVMLAQFDDSEEAHQAIQEAERELAGLSRSQFEERYFPTV